MTTLSGEELADLGIINATDLRDFLAFTATSTVSNGAIVFVDGQFRGGLEILSELPIEAIASITRVEGADAVASGAQEGMVAIFVHLKQNVMIRRVEIGTAATTRAWTASGRASLTWRDDFHGLNLLFRSFGSVSEAQARSSIRDELDTRDRLSVSFDTRLSGLGEFQFEGELREAAQTPSMAVPDGADANAVVRYRSRVGGWWTFMGEVGAQHPNASQPIARPLINTGLFLAGPIMPWGNEAVLAVSRWSREQLAYPTDPALVGWQETRALGLSIPLTALPIARAVRDVASISLSGSWGSATGPEGASSSTTGELALTRSGRWRLSVFWTDQRRVSLGSWLPACDEPIEVDADPSDDSAICEPLAGRVRADSFGARFTVGLRAFSRWSLTVEWLKRDVIGALVLAEGMPEFEYQSTTRAAIRLRVWGGLQDRSETRTSQVGGLDRWEFSILVRQDFTVSESTGLQSNRSAIVLRGRIVSRRIVTGATVSYAAIRPLYGPGQTQRVTVGFYADWPLMMVVTDQEGRSPSPVRVRAAVDYRANAAPAELEPSSSTWLSLTISRSF